MAVPVDPFVVAVIVAVSCDVTATDATKNVAVVCPASTVTEAGTVTLTLLDDRITTLPPVGAAVVRITVASCDTPEVIVLAGN